MLKLIDNPPPWPNGARCAVCFSFDFDAESLLHLYYPEDSTRRISLSSSLRYGARVAVPRIARIWKHFGIRQTVFVPGWCIETYPAAIEALLADGHELGHHGWLHERPNQLSREDERAVLERGMAAIEKVTGNSPALSTSGGTSDARFIKDFCPVVEFGLVGQTMHMVDERVAVEDLETLTQIYQRFLEDWFG